MWALHTDKKQHSAGSCRMVHKRCNLYEETGLLRTYRFNYWFLRLADNASVFLILAHCCDIVLWHRTPRLIFCRFR
jgi:hypothetical protein